MSGTATPNLPLSNGADDVIGNSGGNTVRIALSRLAALLSYLQGPAYKTSAELFADKAWPDGAIGQVYGDTAGQNGTYRKSGAAGTGGWTRTGDLAVSPLTVAQLADKADLSLVNELISEVRTGRVYAPHAATVSAMTPPAGTDRLLTSAGASVQYWVTANAPADGVATDALQADATGQWWQRVFDGRDLTAEIAARVAAIRNAGVLPLANVAGSADAVTADLSPALGDIQLSVLSTVELIPVATNTGPVTLNVNGSGDWPVQRRNGSAVAAGDIAAGRGYILRRRGSAWRMIGLLDSDVQVLVNVEATARTAEDSKLSLALRDGAIIPLTNIAGTGDAITADLNATMINAGITSLSAISEVEYAPVATNAAANPTITIAGVTYGIRDDDGGTWPAGGFSTTRIYKLRRRATTLRVVSGAVIRADIAAEAAARADAIAGTGVLPLTNLSGTADAIIADLPAEANPQSFIAGKLVRITPTVDATVASATISVAGVTRTIRDVDLSPFTEPFLKSGRSYVFETYGSGLLRLVAAPKTQTELDAWDAGTDAKLDILKDAPAYADGSRALMRFGGRDIMRMYPDGPRLSGSAAEVWQPAGTRGIAAIDQFEVVGGYRYPSAMIDGVSRKAIIISVYGQSNADVTEMDDSLIWAAPPMPNHILMLNDVSGARGGLRGWLGVAAPAGSSLIPAQEDAVLVSGKYVQSYATAAASRLNDLTGGPYRVFAVRASGVGGQKLVGEAAGQGIWKDSGGAYVQSWLNWSQDVRNMRDSLLALGYEIEAVHVCFTHQEADWQSARTTYAAQMTDMVAEREVILATDLPGVPVRWFVDQASGSGYRTPGYVGGAWPDRMAIHDVVQAHGNMWMVMPRYHMRFGFNGGALENIHHAFYDRINPQGETYAHAMREVMEGRDWRCPWPTAAAISGNDVVIDFDSIEPLVLDPSFCKARPDLGFELWTGAAAVPASNVRLTGQRQVTATFPTAPGAGQYLRYAYHQLDGFDVSDEWPLSTGALRDAWEADSLFLPGKRLVRPALGFELEL